MVSRCGAPPGLQLGACALGLPPDSFHPTWIGAEGRTERKKWVAALTSHPPPMGAPLAHFGEQGIHIPMSSHTVGGGHITRSSSPPYQPRPSSLPTPPTQGFLSWGWVPQGGGGQPVGTLLATGLAALGIFYSALYNFVAALQGVVAAGVSSAVPSPSHLP